MIHLEILYVTKLIIIIEINFNGKKDIYCRQFLYFNLKIK